MKVLIVGAGIIGSVFGWALTDGGHDIPVTKSFQQDMERFAAGVKY